MLLVNFIYRKIKHSYFTIKTRGVKFFLNRFLVSLSSRLRLSNFYLGQPTAIVIEVTTRCNLGCLQCSRQGDFAHLIDINKDMPEENFIKIFYKFPYLETIGFSGFGDPLLYPRIFEIIEYIQQQNPYINIFLSTNGTIFQDEAKINRILNSGINMLQISWNGAKSETIKKLQGITNFEKIVNNLKLLVKNKREDLSVHLNFVLMPENYQELVEYIRLADFLGINRVTVNRRNYAGFTHRQIDTALFYSSSELLSQIRKAKEEAIRREIMFTYPLVPKCSLWESVIISVGGQVIPCDGKPISRLLNIGNILTQSYSEIAKSDILKRLRRSVANGERLSYCHNCYLV